MAVTAFSQNPKQTYKDALIFDLKGHVKECIKKSVTKTDDGNMFSALFDGEDEFTYSFSSSGKYTSERKQRTTKYDSTGKLVFERYYIEGVFNGGYKEVTYKYNKKGLLIEESGTEPFDETSQSFKTTYSYDEKGFLKKETAESEFSTPLIITYKVISVDDNGNWTKRIGKSDNSTTTETRIITYY